MTSSGALAPALAHAARIVADVAAGASLGDRLAASDSSATSRAAVIDLTHGTLRRYGRGSAIVRELSRHSGPEPLVEALLWCGLYALASGRYAPYTVVDHSVRACALLERWPAKGYVNALLRNFLRDADAIEARAARDPESRYQHPKWWIDLVCAAYAREWERALDAGNTHPPMGLRVNRRRMSVTAYLAQLVASGLRAERVGEDGLLLERPVPIERLPGFANGDVSVQDAGAQRAARCLDLCDGQRVLDACAAPGGKSAHILELADVRLTALDTDASRAARIAPNLERLGLRGEVRVGDAARPDDWWDDVPFDRVLADVPCSASGIARRRPDVKWLRRERDVSAFAARQASLLAGLWRVLAPGGKLLYVPCSIFPQENDAVVAAFLQTEPRAQRVTLPDGAAAQWLPERRHDGFYSALIEKKP